MHRRYGATERSYSIPTKNPQKVKISSHVARKTAYKNFATVGIPHRNAYREASRAGFKPPGLDLNPQG